MDNVYISRDENGAYVKHYGVKGMKKGVRRYTNEDGSLNAAGENRYRDRTPKANGSLNATGKNRYRNRTPKANGVAKITTPTGTHFHATSTIFGRRGEATTHYEGHKSVPSSSISNKGTTKKGTTKKVGLSTVQMRTKELDKNHAYKRDNRMTLDNMERYSKRFNNSQKAEKEAQKKKKKEDWLNSIKDKVQKVKDFVYSEKIKPDSKSKEERQQDYKDTVEKAKKREERQQKVKDFINKIKNPISTKSETNIYDNLKDALTGKKKKKKVNAGGMGHSDSDEYVYYGALGGKTTIRRG